MKRKVLIEIDDRDYTDIMSDSERNLNHYERLIKKGIPLPKGHGDLIDRNKLAHKMVIEDVSRFKEEPEALAGLFLRMCNKEQPIIEADTENEE